MTTGEDRKGLLSLPRRAVRRAYLQLTLERLKAANRSAGFRITSAGGPVVSLTSFGNRIDTVYLAIESIARGYTLPSELILWLDDEVRYHSLPPTLQRLARRGLTIKLSKNYGPHTKYYPYVASQQRFSLPLVTADDDIIYPRHWLQTLTAALQRNPGVIHCYRARVIEFRAGRIAPYREWPLCRSTSPSWRNLLLGVSGVIYPPDFVTALKRAGTAFEQFCPKADDLWLHANALRAGFKVRQLGKESVHFPTIPGSQQSALHFSNIVSGNDSQVAQTYTAEDLQRIVEDAPAATEARFVACQTVCESE
jgi:hypothetical protein